MNPDKPSRSNRPRPAGQEKAEASARTEPQASPAGEGGATVFEAGGSPPPGTILEHDPSKGAPPATASTTRYRVLGELGRGGMGRVLRVFDPAVGREVAKKVMLSGHGSGSLERRFLREGRVTGQIEHPNIVPVYEIGTDADGARYFTMKLVRGLSLAELLRRPAGQGGESLPALLRIFLKVCDAVSYAHSRGVIHRDLKPENVMTGDFGEVLVMDWGLARTSAAEDEGPAATATVHPDEGGSGPRLTAVGSAMGTPAYMPPEQALGDQDAVDERSDVYSLGAILYEILAGRPPFEGRNSREVLESVIEGKFVPPRAAAPGRSIPRELDAIVRKALAREPDLRYAGAPELADDVTRYLEGRPVRALPEGWARRALKWAARHPGASAATIAILVVVLLAGSGIGYLVYDRELERSASLEDRTRLAEEKARAEGELARAASVRARALVPYFKVVHLVDRNLSPEEMHEHVVPALEEAVAIDPDFVEGYLALGLARATYGEFDLARRAFETADARCRDAYERTGTGVPGSPRALYLLGVLSERVRLDRDEAEVAQWPDPATFYRRAGELAPSDPYSSIARLYLSPTAQSAREAEALLAQYPYLAEAYSVYVYATLQSAGDIGELPAEVRERMRAHLSRAIELLGHGIEERVRLAEFHWNRAILVMEEAGRSVEPAVADLREAEHLAGHAMPRHQRAALHRDLGRALLAAGLEEEALARLADAASIDPEYLDPVLRAAEYQLSRARSPEALALFQAAEARLPPGNVDLASQVLFGRIVAAVESGLPAEASEALGRVPLPWRSSNEVFLWSVPDWGERLMSALASLARHFRETGGGGETRSELQRFLSAMATGGAKRAAELLGQRNPEEAHHWATVALLALEGLDAPPENLEINILGARSTAAYNLGRYADAAGDLERSLRANPRTDETLRLRAGFDSFNLALCRASLGAGEGGPFPDATRVEVLRLLAEAAELGFDRADVVLRQEVLAPLVSDPEFQAILARMRR